MSKNGKFIAAILLFPLCLVITKAMWEVAGNSFSMRALSPELLSVGAGFILWIPLYLYLPRPMATYVLGHELTHAACALLMGGRVKKMELGRTSGSVSVTKSNFLISLTPYFFPFYSVLLLLIYVGLNFFFRVDQHMVVWCFLLGISYSFHLTFTLSVIKTKQTDILKNGRLFSFVIIYLGNMIFFCLWMIATGPIGFIDFIVHLLTQAVYTYGSLLSFCSGLIF